MHPTDIALNDYVDEALDEAARADVERHLEGCDTCRRTVGDLRAVKNAGATLPTLMPPERAWERIKSDVARDRAAAPAKAAAYEWRRWLAAAAVLILAVGGGWYFVARGRHAPAPAPTAPVSAADNLGSELLEAETHYRKAITGLEQITNSEKGVLDPQTAATVQKNLGVIDQAIDESRAALKQQPSSEPAQQSLLENFRTKLALLEDTVALINEMRKGNEAGAARIASGLKQKG